MSKKRRFKFSPGTIIWSVTIAVICYSMSYWQYTRYVGKIAYFEVVEEQLAAGRHPLELLPSDWSKTHHALVRLSGAFDYEREVVIINRSMDQHPGVKLVTPLKITGSEYHVLVDRGFLPYDNYASGDLTAYRPQGRQELEGVVRPSQIKAFFLTPSIPAPTQGTWKKRWLRLEIAKMAEQLPYPLLPVYIEQTNQDGEYPAHLTRSVVPPSRHLNYTIQWAGFATFSLGFGLFLQWVRPARKVSGPLKQELKE